MKKAAFFLTTLILTGLLLNAQTIINDSTEV